ncbi:MAG TPA: hypothetical protein VFI65_01915 [Streptosporangiaceae bacterium]|nr:hypothetical protein [Streptosporangiaceae bacterium]
MSGTARISVEWALRGYGGQMADHSQGLVKAQDLSKMLELYVPGALKELELPQVTAGPLTSELSYIAFTIHRRRGRAELFCVNFADLTGNIPSYSDLYAAFGQVALPLADQRPARLEITVTPRLTAPDDLAMVAAALLLTDRKICVLGADGVPLEERLRFIDDVASCIPYGMRGRLAVTTWVKPSVRNHEFRLFFSSARPNGGELALSWGNRVSASIAVPQGQAYLDWLRQDIYRRLDQLAEAQRPAGFSPGEVAPVLRRLGVLASAPESSEPAVSPADTGAASLLDECAYWFNEGQRPDQLQRRLTDLRKHLDRTHSDVELRRYRRIIREERLFRKKDVRLEPSVRIEFYLILIRLAYETPLSYQSYCEIEATVGYGASDGRMSHPMLAEAMRQIGTKDRDVELLVLAAIDREQAQQSLSEKRDPPAALVEMATRQRRRIAHEQVLCGAAIWYMVSYPDPELARKALSQHGYLAATLTRLYPDDHNHQVRLLGALLKAVFGPSLTNDDIAELLGSGPPTPALVKIVTEQVNLDTDPIEALLLLIYGQASIQEIDPIRRKRYSALLKSIDGVLVEGPQGRSRRGRI